MHRDVREKSSKLVFTQVSLLDSKFHKQFHVAETILGQISVRIDEVIAARNTCVWLFEKVYWVLVWEILLIRRMAKNWGVIIERIWCCSTIDGEADF